MGSGTRPVQTQLLKKKKKKKKKNGRVNHYTLSIIGLKVHKIENFFDSDFGICVISLLGMSKY